MNTFNKSKQKPKTAKIVAGLLPNDPHIEFGAIKDTKKVIWLQHGGVHRFEDLSDKNFKTLQLFYLDDRGAQRYFHRHQEANMPITFRRKVELYIYYMCGQLDGTPDLVDGKLNFSENFRETRDCVSLNFDAKHITIDGVKLTSREIRIIDFMKDDLKDDAIASELKNRNGKKGIATSTFNSHKKNLFDKVGVGTRNALVQKATAEGI